MAAIAQIAEVQAMHAQFTQLCDELFDYAQKIRNSVMEQVLPAIVEAVGDTPVETGAQALALMQQHQDADISEALRLIQTLRIEVMHNQAYSKTLEAVGQLEAYSQGL